LFLTALHESNLAASSVMLTLRTQVAPTAAIASPFEENTEEYPPMYNDTPPPYAFPAKASMLTTQLENMLFWIAILKNETLRSRSPADRPK
jgi:hypothetical protein